MIKVVGIKFLNGNRIYYFSPGKNPVKNGDNVIVETERGTQFGLAVTDIAGLCGELAALGFDEIVLENCTYPVRGKLDRLLGSDGDPLTAIEGPDGFLEQVRQALEPYGTVLSVRAELGMINGTQPGGGLSAAGLNTYARRIWVDREEVGSSPVQLLEDNGIENAPERVVELVEQLEKTPEFRVEQAQLNMK